MLLLFIDHPAFSAWLTSKTIKNFISSKIFKSDFEKYTAKSNSVTYVRLQSQPGFNLIYLEHPCIHFNRTRGRKDTAGLHLLVAYLKEMYIYPVSYLHFRSIFIYSKTLQLYSTILYMSISK